MKIFIDCDILSALLELPDEEQRLIAKALAVYPNVPDDCCPQSSMWLHVKRILDAKLAMNEQLAERNRINGAKHTGKKTEPVDIIPEPEIQPIIKPCEPAPASEPEEITTDSEIEYVENRFIPLSDDFEILAALRDPNSALNSFLNTGAGYDELTKSECQFADRGDVRALCTWHKEIMAATKALVRKPFVPPTLDDWLAFCREKNLDLDRMRNAYESYQVADWHDSEGKPIRNWKQKILMVWASNHKNYNQKSANFAPKTALGELYSGLDLAEKILKERGVI